MSSTSLLRYWFGPRPYTPARLAERMEFWFGSGATREQMRQRDEEIRAKFAGLMQQAAAGELDRWSNSPRQRLALIILLDQMPRHVHRGKAPAYALDARAAELALEGIQVAADGALAPVERIFFYMPLQHAESPEMQEESVAACRRLLAEAPAGTAEYFQRVLQFAELHRDIIAQYGRFPHRNLALGRKSTQAEMMYLLGGGPRFGTAI